MSENATGQANEPWTHDEIVKLQWRLRLCVDYPADLLGGRRG